MNIEKKRVIYASVFPLLFLLLLWLIQTFSLFMDWDLHHLGIYPLTRKGVVGIFTQIFIHSGYSHLLANSIPLFILGWMLFYFYRDISHGVFLSLWILGGLLTWIISRPGWHVGASGLIYGLAFFLFFSGIFRRDRKLMSVSLIVAFLYGNTIWNMLPIASLYKVTTSWEGHLSGALSGVLIAMAFRSLGPQRERLPIEDEEDEVDEEVEMPGDPGDGPPGTIYPDAGILDSESLDQTDRPL